MELIDADTDEDEIEDKDRTTDTKTSEGSFSHTGLACHGLKGIAVQKAAVGS